MAPSETLVRGWRATLSSAELAERFTLWLRGNKLLVWARKLLPFVASGIGLWFCVRFCTAFEWRAFEEDLKHVGVGFALLLLAPIVSNFVHMVGWRGLLPAAARPSLGRSLAISLAAQAGNEIGLGVLGESLKVSEFPSEQRPAALRAMVLDNLAALAALVAVVLSMALFLAGVAAQPSLPRALALGALAAFGLASLVALGIWQRKSGGSARSLLLAFAAHYLGKLWIVAEFALVLALLGTVTLRSSAVLGLVSTLASAAGAAIPGQLGVLEAALKGSAATCGLGACTLVSVAVLRRARSMLWVVLGALLFWQLRLQRVGPSSQQPVG
ncbi:MAG TPA: hypothetical protein VNW92_03655 [Polyangiaceae bacterium]|nr:hypothetical protein [Polyangiaceae bacterium]